MPYDKEGIIDLDDFDFSMPYSSEPHFIIYKEGMAESIWSAEQLILGGRALLMDGKHDPEGSLLVAKLVQGQKSIYLFVDRDSFEFVSQQPKGRAHITSGNLASALRWIPLQGLEKIMKGYLDNLSNNELPLTEKDHGGDNYDLGEQAVSVCYLPMIKTTIGDDKCFDFLLEGSP